MLFESINIGHGVSVDRKARYIGPIRIPTGNRKGHFWCFATTQSGKTRLAEHMIVQDIISGNNVICIDPKGDIDILNKMLQVCIETGRVDDFIYLDPFFPEFSCRINPLSHYKALEELSGHMVSGIETGREPFFYNVSYELSTILVKASILLGRDDNPTQMKEFNFEYFKDQISHYDLNVLKMRLLRIQSDESRKLIADIDKILNSTAEYYSKVASSLRVALMELCHGGIGDIVGQAYGNPIFDRLYQKKGVAVFVRLGSLITRKASYTLGKTILSMLQAYVGRVFLSGRKLTPPLCVYVDEAQSVLYNGIDDLFAKAGGAGCWVHGFSQSYNQIVAALGKDKANSILDNINTKMWMRLPDPETAQYALKHFGTQRRFLPILTNDGNFSLRESEELLLNTNHFMELQPQQFYMYTYSGNFKGLTANCNNARLNLVYPEEAI